jgi:hypothetical protein
MKTLLHKILATGAFLACFLLLNLKGYSQQRTLPNGTIIYSDGSRKLPNGTIVQRETTRHYYAKKHPTYNRSLPPGQVKKIYGTTSARTYAPGHNKAGKHNGQQGNSKGHKD